MPTDSASFGLQVIEHLQQTIDEMVRQLHRQNDWLNPRVQSLARLYLATLRHYLTWSKIAFSDDSRETELPIRPKPNRVTPVTPLSGANSTRKKTPAGPPQLVPIPPAPFPAPGLLRSAPRPPLHEGASLGSSPAPELPDCQQSQTG